MIKSSDSTSRVKSADAGDASPSGVGDAAPAGRSLTGPGGLEARGQGSRSGRPDSRPPQMSTLRAPLRAPVQQNIGGLNTIVTVDSSAQNVDRKMNALRGAVAAVNNRFPNALASIEQLPVVLGNALATEASWHPEDPTGAPSMYLGDRSLFRPNPVASGQMEFARMVQEREAAREGAATGESSSAGAPALTEETVGIWGNGENGKRGVADQRYDEQRKSVRDPARWLLQATGRYQSSKIEAKAEAVVVHELGHLLHAAQSPDQFWAGREVDAPVVDNRIAQQVSSYAMGNNPAEFVAEVFTGIVYDKTYSPQVMAEYARNGGPLPPGGAGAAATPLAHDPAAADEASAS
jgi:hypothetical protein